MKITNPFHGLTSGEQKRLTEIRFLAQVDLVAAQSSFCIRCERLSAA